ncbi:MAG: hypothetical protein R2991_10320 [Thermoanaerobaculia bacterium]
MSRRLVLVLLGGLVGYVVGVTAGAWVAERVLGAAADGGLRAATAGVFVLGPLVAILGAIAGAIVAGKT